MILVVSLNPALDLTYEVDAADWAGVNRPHTVHVRPGGKGVNVARTLAALGRQVRLAGLVGGSAGRELVELLAGSGIELAFTPIVGATRRTLTVVDGAREQAALFNEPGPGAAADEYATFVAGYQAGLGDCSAVVLSGSLPRGVEIDAYAGLIEIARTASVPVILDTSGPGLALGVAAGPTLVKPNLAELDELTGRGGMGGTQLSVLEGAARELLLAGARSVVVSRGQDGLLAVTGDGCLLARPGEPVSGNPTGAGDAVVAGLADGLVRGLEWPDLLRHAVALGAATVAAPVAGEFVVAEYVRQHRDAKLSKSNISDPRVNRPGLRGAL